MKAITCELCSGNDFVRAEDGLFQCQHCGTKYTPDAMRSMMSGDAVRVKAADFVIEAGVLLEYHGELADVVVPDTVRGIGNRAFSGKAIESVVLPEGLEWISDGQINGEWGAFSRCDRLRRIRIPQSVSVIGAGAFSGCASLEEVIFEDSEKGSLLDINAHAFSGCTALRALAFPTRARTIGPRAFAGCANLAHVRFEGPPSAITEVKAQAFAGTPALREVAFDATEGKGKSHPFSGNDKDARHFDKLPLFGPGVRDEYLAVQSPLRVTNRGSFVGDMPVESHLASMRAFVSYLGRESAYDDKALLESIIDSHLFDACEPFITDAVQTYQAITHQEAQEPGR